MKIKDASKKIAVIGSGPAGIFAATGLKQAGFSDITLYGKFDEAQCRTKHVEGVVADVGTCYVHSGYFNSIKQFVKQYDIHIKYLEVDPKTVNSSDINKDLKPGFAEKVKTYIGLFFFLIHSFIWKILKHTWAGRIIYGISFEKYLKRVGLGFMGKGFVFGPGGVAQGYGFLKDVSAYRLFRWFRPSIFLTPIMNKRKKGTGIIKEGYGTLFNRAYLSVSNRKESLVRSVVPLPNNKVRISEERGPDVDYDIVIVACPLKNVTTPVSPLLEEGDVVSTPFFSCLWTSEKPPFFEDRVYIKDYINENQTDVISTFRLWGKTPSGKFVYWGVGYPSKGISREDLKQSFENQINNSFGLTISTIEFFNVFDYNVRFSTEAIRNGLHLKIRGQQGVNNVWYSGGMLSHWDVDSIFEFNRNLLQKLIYKNNKSISNFFKYSLSLFRNFFQNM